VCVVDGVPVGLPLTCACKSTVPITSFRASPAATRSLLLDRYLGIILILGIILDDAIGSAKERDLGSEQSGGNRKRRLG
jgi:hypothetical protein